MFFVIVTSDKKEGKSGLLLPNIAITVLAKMISGLSNKMSTKSIPQSFCFYYSNIFHIWFGNDT